MRITGYHILIADNPVDLSELVRFDLKHGWEPLDGHRVVQSLDPTNGDILWQEYSQTMVKRETTE